MNSLKPLPAYYGSLRDMPVGQQLYIKKKMASGLTRHCLCEFVRIERGYVVGKVLAVVDSKYFIDNNTGEVRARAKDCFMFLKVKLPWASCHWFPSLDEPALKEL